MDRRAPDKADCAALLQANGVPSTPVNLPGELLTSPQLAHRGSLTGRRAWEAGKSTVLGPPWSVHREPPARGRNRVWPAFESPSSPTCSPAPSSGRCWVRWARPYAAGGSHRLDIYRRSGPFADGVAGIERGAYFAVANHSKRSVLIDRDAPIDEVAAVLAESDVLIENVGSSRLQRACASTRPRWPTPGTLTLRVSGFGSDGPLAGYRVYANNVQSYGGLAGLSTSG